MYSGQYNQLPMAFGRGGGWQQNPLLADMQAAAASAFNPNYGGGGGMGQQGASGYRRPPMASSGGGGYRGGRGRELIQYRDLDAPDEG